LLPAFRSPIGQQLLCIGIYFRGSDKPRSKLVGIHSPCLLRNIGLFNNPLNVNCFGETWSYQASFNELNGWKKVSIATLYCIRLCCEVLSSRKKCWSWGSVPFTFLVRGDAHQDQLECRSLQLLSLQLMDLEIIQTQSTVASAEEMLIDKRSCYQKLTTPEVQLYLVDSWDQYQFWCSIMVADLLAIQELWPKWFLWEIYWDMRTIGVHRVILRTYSKSRSDGTGAVNGLGKRDVDLFWFQTLIWEPIAGFTLLVILMLVCQGTSFQLGKVMNLYRFWSQDNSLG